MPLVPLTGQSRKARPRAASAPAQRSVSVGEIVLIWTTGWSGRSTVMSPSGPRMTSSTAAREGSTVQTASVSPATATGESAGTSPSAVRAARRPGTMS